MAIYSSDKITINSEKGTELDQLRQRIELQRKYEQAKDKMKPYQ